MTPDPLEKSRVQPNLQQSDFGLDPPLRMALCTVLDTTTERRDCSWYSSKLFVAKPFADWTIKLDISAVIEHSTWCDSDSICLACQKMSKINFAIANNV